MCKFAWPLIQILVRIPCSLSLFRLPQFSQPWPHLSGSLLFNSSPYANIFRSLASTSTMENIKLEPYVVISSTFHGHASYLRTHSHPAKYLVHAHANRYHTEQHPQWIHSSKSHPILCQPFPQVALPPSGPFTLSEFSRPDRNPLQPKDTNLYANTYPVQTLQLPHHLKISSSASVRRRYSPPFASSSTTAASRRFPEPPSPSATRLNGPSTSAPPPILSVVSMRSSGRPTMANLVFSSRCFF